MNLLHFNNICSNNIFFYIIWIDYKYLELKIWKKSLKIFNNLLYFQLAIAIYAIYMWIRITYLIMERITQYETK